MHGGCVECRSLRGKEPVNALLGKRQKRVEFAPIER
jgi:hypothetical protein